MTAGEKIQAETDQKLANPWQVILFNDEVHTFDEVIFQIQKATGYSLEKASQITRMVHENGRALVWVGDKPKCERVGDVLKLIGLEVSIEKT